MNPTTPDTPERGELNLRRAVNSLPAHEPDPATWPRLAAQLAADEALARAIPALPAHEPADDLWASIAARLDAPAAAPAPALTPTPAPSGVVRALWPARTLRRALAVAASVLVLLGAWWQLRPAALAPAGLHETLTYSEEAAPAALAVAPPDPLEQEGQAFIDAHCSSLPAVCQSGQFQALRTQLTELETQEARLRQDARRFGTSPELLREQAQLVNLKATVTRELVQLLIS